MVRDAHAINMDDRILAHERLFEHYHTAIYRYLLGATHDPHVAEELFQDFAVRLCSGKLATASPDRGSFRNYLRTVLINLINDHRRRRKPIPAAAEPSERDIPPELDLDKLYLTALHEDLLATTWNVVRCFEESSGQLYFTILHARATQPDLTSDELTDWLNQQRVGHPPLVATSLRKTVQRAREYFSDVLIEEVAQRLGTHVLSEIEGELIELNLHAYCQTALDRRRARLAK